VSTYGQAMISEINESLRLLNQYIIEGYDGADIKKLLSSIASATELFLKRDVFPTKNNQDNFYSYIEELKTHSISQAKVDFIHDIRVAYNGAKHDPNSVISILEVKDLIENLKIVVAEIVINGTGRVSTSVKATTTRVFWVCAWDHLTGGETEVTIFLPSEYDGFLGAHSVDRVSIDFSNWHDFKADLPNFGAVKPHEGLIPEGQVQFWLSEGDCLTPFVFEGEYSSLIICLSKYLKDIDLIPGLAREDDPVNLLQTTVMAVIDVYANDPNASKDLQCASALSLANNQYAILPKFNDRIEPFIRKVVDVIDQESPKVKSALTGPIWVTKEAYDSSDSTYRDDNIRTLIDSKNRVVLGVRNL
jgi:hypothetical protein